MNKIKDAYYFQHDSNARHDPKIKALIKKYGVEGYGRYFILLENLREASNYKLKDKEYTWEALAEDFRCESKEVKKFVDDCIEIFELLDRGDGWVYSLSLVQRMIKLDAIREKRRQAGIARWE